MTTADVWELVKNGGPPVILLLMIAIGWLLTELKREREDGKALEHKLDEKADEVKTLAVQVITLAAELKMFLFNERKS